MANVDFDGNTQPKSLVSGVNSVWQRVSVSATTSAGDVLRVLKLPHGAVLDEVVVYGGAAYVAGITEVGIESDEDRFFESATLSLVAPHRAIIGLGEDNQISLSDDADVRYEYLTITPGAAVSVGVHFIVNARYHLDEVT